MITAEELKLRLSVINTYWKDALAKYARCTGTDEECEKIAKEVDRIHKSFSETGFSRDIAIAVVNELDKIMTENNSGKRNGRKMKIVELNSLIKELRKNGFDSVADYLDKNF